MKNVIFLCLLLSLSLLEGQNFAETQKLIGDNPSRFDGMGASCSIKGSFLIIGAFGRGGNKGGAYIYQKNASGDNWALRQEITGSDVNSQERFGLDVDISNNFAACGAPTEQEDNNGNNPMVAAGAVYVFERQPDSTWTELTKLVSTDRDMGDRFGASVSLSDSVLAVGVQRGAEDENGNNYLGDAGEVFIYSRSSTGNWGIQQKIVASDREPLDEFGYSIHLEGDKLIVGALREDDDENGQNTIDDAGAAYIFEKNVSGVWQETAKIVASDREAEALFGFSVSISGDYAVVGAKNKNKNINGNIADNAGAAYVFKKQADGSWVEVEKLDPSDSDEDDFFGETVFIQSDYILIGATSEEGDNSLSFTGAVYVFQLDQISGWQQVQKLYSSDKESNDVFGSSLHMDGSQIVVGAFWENQNRGAAYVFNRDFGVGISEPFANSPITAYPNPTSANVSLDLRAKYNHVSISVLDLMGKQVAGLQSTSTSHVNVPLSEYSTGIYFLVCDLDGERHTVKVVRE